MERKNFFKSLANTFSLLGKCLLALVVCIVCRALVIRDNYILYFVAVILLAVPMAVYSCAKTMLRKEFSLKHYNPKSAMYKMAKKRWPIYTLHIVASCLLSFVLAVYVATFSRSEGLACAVTLPIVLVVHMLVTKLAEQTYKKKYAEYHSSFWKDIVILIAGALLYSFLVCQFGGVDVAREDVFQVNKIAFVIDGILRGINTVTYALLNNDLVMELASPFYLALSIFTLQGGILFLALTRFFLCWFLPKDRMNSVFIPVTNLLKKIDSNDKRENPPKKIGKFFIGQKIAFFSATLTFAVLLQLGLWWACTHENWAKLAVDKTTLIAEQVGNEVCRIGTSAKYALLGEEFEAKTKEELGNAVNTYFDQMVQKTDNYLDWYYSLGREYTELFTFLAGVVENQVEEKVAEFLDKNMESQISPGYDLEEQLGTIYDNNFQKFQDAKELLFQQNRIENPNGLFHVEIKTTLPDVIQRVDKPEGIMTGKQKFIVTTAGGTVAGVATGIVTKKLLAKLSTKLTQKAATKAVTTAAKSAVKKGASKAISSALSGAVAGLAAGPAGAVVGVVVGVATTFGLDKLLLEIDELTNRNDYKADIISCIEEERMFYLDLVNNL